MKKYKLIEVQVTAQPKTHNDFYNKGEFRKDDLPDCDGYEIDFNNKNGLDWIEKSIFEKNYTRMYEPHEERVVQEHAELQEKISKLRDFLYSPIFQKMLAADKKLLIQQLETMDAYALILSLRINNFK
jgi:DNA mismatch repair ATPase MutS